ncbi:hypothetical protein [Nocardioides marmotae]|uniref:hypothetical protein n=1 Tax=Nocardioides marmotae TaxID=2663857 RepID=UPI0012B5C704|nr:hypothetical protein [Nocardioides marmotae]MBC9734075.1 hypothetical protein [Nocardioides marmotae]MTB85178.1 hypothetical protein [Nocardioides marmotae]
MTWTSFHHRGEILRSVIRVADRRRDGLLPMDLAGVRETFGDELALYGALSLRWHTRLAGRIERELMHQPLDLEGAVITAWRAMAEELPGIRAILDHYREEPVDAAMAEAIAKATRKEHILLAIMAGRASVHDSRGAALAAETGARIEQRARALDAVIAAARSSSEVREAGLRPALRHRLGRLRAALAA